MLLVLLSLVVDVVQLVLPRKMVFRCFHAGKKKENVVPLLQPFHNSKNDNDNNSRSESTPILCVLVYILALR